MTERPGEELVPADDTIIGRAFRWSLVVVVLAAAAVGVGIWATRRAEPETPPQPPPEIEPIAPAPVFDPPSINFGDITGSAGIDFSHTSGARGDKLLPETMGGGCAFLDYDSDGDQDLLLVNGGHWSDDAGDRPVQALYANDGNGRFSDVTRETGLAVSLYGMGAAVGDFDNDGDPDLYLTAVGENRLFRNDDGRFTDVTTASGTAGGNDEWSTSAGFFDYDNDGDLDLFVCNYVRWSRQIDFEVDYRLTGIGRAYGPPTNFEGSFPRLFRNEGNGRFNDVSTASGIQVTNPATGVPVAKALGVTFADVGGDGLIDIFVANDTVRNFLYRNQGDGTFQEVGAESGVAYSGMGQATGAMGIDAAHYRNGRELGWAIGNFANEMTSLYVTQVTDWQFADEAIAEGIGAPSRKALSFGLFFFDADLDGRLDLLQANGHLEEEINAVQPSQHYRQSAQLFWNAGPAARACFVEVPAASTGDLAQPLVGRGAAYADIDDDGDLDVLLTQVDGPPLLLRNEQTLGHHWLRLRLVGRRCNRDAIGAWVEVTPNGGPVQRRQVMPTRGYLSQVELPVTFGLGEATFAESVTVLWPDGSRQVVHIDDVDVSLTVVQEEP
jgi:hypothetical protein